MKLNYAFRPLVANAFGVQTLTVPANKTSDPSLRAGYDYNLGHRGGVLVNNSVNACWCLLFSRSESFPSRITVVDFGVRINGNGGQLLIPDQSNCFAYLATNATSNIEIRALYYLRK